jgi:hypothetical protein
METSLDPGSDDAADGRGPLRGVRVLDTSATRPGRIAAMLLADLGADVLRVGAADPPGRQLTAESVCWDRGKRLREADQAEIGPLAGQADVIIVDGGPAAVRASGLDRARLTVRNPSLVHVWMPPYGEKGEWADVPEHPLLLAALSGLAVYYPADDESPIAPVASCLTYLHGALGAAAAVGGLVGRARQGRQPARDHHRPTRGRSPAVPALRRARPRAGACSFPRSEVDAELACLPVRGRAMGIPRRHHPRPVRPGARRSRAARGHGAAFGRG